MAEHETLGYLDGSNLALIWIIRLQAGAKLTIHLHTTSNKEQVKTAKEKRLSPTLIHHPP